LNFRRAAEAAAALSAARLSAASLGAAIATACAALAAAAAAVAGSLAAAAWRATAALATAATCRHGRLARGAGLGLVLAQAHEQISALLAVAELLDVRGAGDHRARTVARQLHPGAFGQAVAA